MKPGIILFVFFLSVIKPATGQNYSYAWTSAAGDSGQDWGRALTVDSDGNVYTTGSFSGTVDFDPDSSNSFLLTSNGDLDIFVQKLNSNGDLIWANSIGGQGEDMGRAIHCNDNGELYIAGRFQNTFDFDPGAGTLNLTSNGTKDFFVQKLDTAGNFVWAVSVGGGGTSWSDARSIVTDDNGDVYVYGNFQATADFDPGPLVANISSNGYADISILKLSSSGMYLWAIKTGGSLADNGRSITIDSNGDIIGTGRFAGTVDFDPGTNVLNLASNGDHDCYIHKIDNNGNLIWAVSFGGFGEDFGRDIVTDSFGNIYCTGEFAGTVDFDPGTGSFPLTSNGQLDIFILKLDPNGNFLWAKSIGGTNDDMGRAVIVEQSNNILVTGFFQDSAYFEPALSNILLVSNGDKDYFLVEFDPSGNTNWAFNIGGPLEDDSRDIAQTFDESLYLTGFFSDFVDFDHGPGTDIFNAQNDNDIFVVKLDPIPSGIEDINSESGIYVYPNITTESITIELFEKCTLITVDIFDGNGKLIKSEDFSDTSSAVTFISGNSGYYYIKVTIPESPSEVFKVLKL